MKMIPTASKPRSKMLLTKTLFQKTLRMLRRRTRINSRRTRRRGAKTIP
jgi:hypothetical protein